MSIKTGAIVGGVLGGVALLLICGGLAVWYHRRSKKQRSLASDASQEVTQILKPIEEPAN